MYLNIPSIGLQNLITVSKNSSTTHSWSSRKEGRIEDQKQANACREPTLGSSSVLASLWVSKEGGSIFQYTGSLGNGQLISKCPYGFFKSTKKPTKEVE